MKGHGFVNIAVTIVLSLILLIFNIKKLYYQCIGVIDYSIYQQAISELSLWQTWNPYLTIRDIFIFNEHFDPIIYLAVPFFELLDHSPYSLVVFEWFWFISFALLCIKNSRLDSKKEFYLVIALLFGLRPILSGFAFVGHPVTWAVVPLLFLVRGLYKDNFRVVIISSVALVVFKETFPFGVFSLSFYYLLRKQSYKFLSLFVIGLFFVLFEMKFREELIGNTFSYGNSFLGEILKDPVRHAIKLFKEFHYGDFFKVLYPFFIPLYFEVKKSISSKSVNAPIVGVFLFTIPLLAIHFIINRYTFHHASKFSAILIGVTVFSGCLKEIVVNKKIFPVVCITFLLSGISWHKKIFKLLILKQSTKCVPSEDRGASRKKMLKKFFSRVNRDSEVFATGGIGPFLIKPGFNIYHSSFSKIPELTEYIVLERGLFSDIYPLSMEDVEVIRRECLKFPHEIIYEDNFYTFAKGQFPKSCILQK